MIRIGLFDSVYFQTFLNNLNIQNVLIDFFNFHCIFISSSVHWQLLQQVWQRFFDDPCGHTRQACSTMTSLNIYWLHLKWFSLSVAALSWLREAEVIFAKFNITPLIPWRQKRLCQFKTQWFVSSLWDLTLLGKVQGTSDLLPSFSTTHSTF